MKRKNIEITSVSDCLRKNLGIQEYHVHTSGTFKILRI